MTISYNNLWKILIDKEMNKGALCSKAKISKGTMAKMTNNEPVTLTVIEKICEVLQCDIGDVVQIVDDGDSEQIYAGERKSIEDEVAVTQGASDKAQRIAERLSACGAYEEINAAVKADIFVLDIADVSGSIRLFSDVMKRLGIRMAGDEIYEEFQKIYDESVGRDVGKEKVEDKVWNRGRGR